MNWFKRKGILFIPASIAGWLICIVLLIYAIYVFLNINKTEHTSGILSPLIFNCIIIFAAYSVIGFFAHQKANKKDQSNNNG